MPHKFHGRWRSFVVFEDDNGDIHANGDDNITLQMPDPANNQVQPGSVHMHLPVTGDASTVGGRSFLELRQAGLNRKYEGFLEESPGGGPPVKIIMGRVRNHAFVPLDSGEAHEDAREEAKTKKELTGQEEGIWVATQP